MLRRIMNVCSLVLAILVQPEGDKRRMVDMAHGTLFRTLEAGGSRLFIRVLSRAYQ